MSEREHVIDFTVPYYDLVGITIMMKKPKVIKRESCHIVWLWDCLIVRLSDCQNVRLWDCLIVRLWDCLIVWLSDCQTVWLSDFLIVRLSDCQTVWLWDVWLSDCQIVRLSDCEMSDCLIVRMSACENVRLSDCLIVWLSDCEIVWLSGANFSLQIPLRPGRVSVGLHPGIDQHHAEIFIVLPCVCRHKHRNDYHVIHPWNRVWRFVGRLFCHFSSALGVWPLVPILLSGFWSRC